MFNIKPCMKKFIPVLLSCLSLNAFADISAINRAMGQSVQQQQRQAMTGWQQPFDIVNEFNRNPNEVIVCANYIEKNGTRSTRKKLKGLLTNSNALNRTAQCMDCYPMGNYIALNLIEIIHPVRITSQKGNNLRGIDLQGNKWQLTLGDQCR